MDKHNIIVFDESGEFKIPVKINPTTSASAIEDLGVAIDAYLDIAVRPDLKAVQNELNSAVANLQKQIYALDNTTLKEDIAQLSADFNWLCRWQSLEGATRQFVQESIQSAILDSWEVPV